MFDVHARMQTCLLRGFAFQRDQGSAMAVRNRQQRSRCQNTRAYHFVCGDLIAQRHGLITDIAQRTDRSDARLQQRTYARLRHGVDIWSAERRMHHGRDDALAFRRGHLRIQRASLREQVRMRVNQAWHRIFSGTVKIMVFVRNGGVEAWRDPFDPAMRTDQNRHIGQYGSLGISNNQTYVSQGERLDNLRYS